jgi:hypothetical protein
MTAFRLKHFAHVGFVLAVMALIFATHSRWIFTHFSSDAYLEDSGWVAYLFESGDPLLRNPSGVDDLSFYAHHLSPHIFLFGAPLSRLFGLTGIEIFAYHQGLFFGLLFLAFYVMAAPSGAGVRNGIIATAAAVLFGGLSNPVFQAAAYPHTEIAMISLASLAIAAWLARARLLFAVCLLWLPLIREDGGFYVTVACVACLAVEHDGGDRQDTSGRLLMSLALIGIVVSACSFLIKAWLFPGFSAFTNNFAGHWWNHVTTAFVLERVSAMLTNWNIMPVLLGCALLSAFDIRYLTGLVLLSPVFLLHLLAIRSEHGYFTLYFALPWIIPCAIWLAVFVRRSKQSKAVFAEAAIIMTAALALAAPIQAAAGSRGSFWFVARWAFERPVVDTREMQSFVLWARKSLAAPTVAGEAHQQRQCVSQGIAALVPNAIRPDEVLTPAADLRTCQVLFLMRGDMHYGALSTRAQTLGFQPMGSRLNAEMWLINKKR